MAVIALLDWGVGGVDLLARLRAARPDLDLRYVSDAGFTPWGLVPPAALAQRVAGLVRDEIGRGATGVLLACNAASTVLPRLEPLARALPHGLHGVIRPGVAALREGPWRDLGVVGGRRAIRSGAWDRPLRDAGFRVRGRVAQPLSARIEAGDCDGPETRALVRRLCAPLRGVEAVVLACTHYPAAIAAFRDALPGVALFDPAGPALAAVLQALPAAAPGEGRVGGLEVRTSGDAENTRRAARLAFGVELGEVVEVGIQAVACTSS